MKTITTSVAQDCTDKCRSIQHGNLINATISSREISDKDLCSYIKYVCERCEHVCDDVGRTALHVAASCGRNDLVRWLVECRDADINAKDKESGYTALHRSVFHGKIHTTVELIKLGARTDIQDNSGLTFLDHIILDQYKPQNEVESGELFTWGPNSNHSLGSDQARDFPELMNIFHKEHSKEDVKRFLISNFHSIILTETGKVFSCGHGLGGRLGLGTQHTELIPRQIKFENNVLANENIEITACCIARDHSLFLTSNKMIFSCGLNKHKVLGIKPPPDNLLTPKLLQFFNDSLISVECDDYHSVAWSSKQLFTWGLHAGQLGHHFYNSEDNKYIVTPKEVKSIDLRIHDIRKVCVSTGATIVCTTAGDIFILHEYQCRKIGRIHYFEDVCAIGGKLNKNLDEELCDKSRDLRVVVLNKFGTIFTWQASDPVMRRCTFSLKRPMLVKQLYLNVRHILLVTKHGDAYRGTFEPKESSQVSVKRNSIRERHKSEFHKRVSFRVERDDFVNIKLENIPRIYRALSIESDPKGWNFGVIQEKPYKDFKYHFINEPCIVRGMLNDSFDTLLQTTSPDDGLTDITLIIENREYFAHKYILASRSAYFSKLFAENPGKSSINLEKIDPEMFNQILKFIYTRRCDVTSGDRNNKTTKWLCEKWGGKNNAKNNQNFARVFYDVAEKFHLNDLKQLLNETALYIRMDGDKIIQKWHKNLKNVQLSDIKFDRNLYPELYDVEIQGNEGKVFKAHKCLLAARSEYFSSMFSTRWMMETYSKISLPVAQEVVECLLDFMYTNSSEKLEELESEQVCDVLKLADLTLLSKLKQKSENILSMRLTIKNTVPLLTLAAMLNADGLRINCYRFIQQNMLSFFDYRVLDDLQTNLFHDFSVFYQNNRMYQNRQITPYSTIPPIDEVVKIASERPVSFKKEPKKIIKNKREDTTKRISFSHDVSACGTDIYQENKKADVNSYPEVQASTLTPHDSPDRPETNHMAENVFLYSRLKAITAVNCSDLSNPDLDNFTPLKSTDGNSASSSFVDDLQFPLLNSPPRGSIFTGNKLTNHKTEAKQRTPKMSQKQRKRLSSESGTAAASAVLSESPKNPWKSLADPVPAINIEDETSMKSIIHSEKKQKENLVKMRNKPLTLTQLEDKAMDELKRFYSIDSVEDELIFVERVSSGAIATPVWVPK